MDKSLSRDEYDEYDEYDEDQRLCEVIDDEVTHGDSADVRLARSIAMSFGSSTFFHAARRS